MEDDAKLIRQAVKGDRSACGLLYDRFARLVRSLCYDTTGDLSSAQDLAQEVFLRAFSKLPKLRQPERFAAWLIGITRHVCSDWRRTRRRDRHEYLPEGPELAVQDLATDDTVNELRQAIRRLPEKERLALHLFYLDEQPAERVRQLLGLSSSGFYKLLERARTRLAQLVQCKKDPGS